MYDVSKSNNTITITTLLKTTRLQFISSNNLKVRKSANFVGLLTFVYLLIHIYIM